MNEAETRADCIDPALRAAGWGVTDSSRILREYPITLGRLQGSGKRAKALLADYVLVYRNTKLAVVEAKAWDKPTTEGLAQAKNYAGMLQTRAAYATNGQGIYAVDMRTGQEGDIDAFPTPDALWAQAFDAPNAWRDRFAAVPFADAGGTVRERYYQAIATERVLEAVAGGRTRILLTLATGTGKTLIACQIAWKLFQSRWNLGGEAARRPRILFLADRNILANQAYNAFAAFPEDALVRINPHDIKKKGSVPKNGSLFFTIFQTFMSGTTGEAETETYAPPSARFGQYPPDFFDFIVVDECHRGGASDESTWRGILEHFAPAVQLGLTATPKRKDNTDTYAYFGEPVYAYSLKQGINDGFLTPFKVKQISTTLDEYVYTPDDTLVQGAVTPGKVYEGGDFNKIIHIKEREAHRVKLFMDAIAQNEKTLVFCATQEHAAQVRDLINQTKTSADPNYCHRVTSDDGALGEQHLRDFQDNEKTIPTILTTSQKLSTGVDARNIRNIVLMRPVRSMIEFKQIIGRGTRLYDGKDYFTVYDFEKAHHHFADPEWDGEPLDPEPALPPPLPPPPRPPVIVGPPREKITVQLADGKSRTIQHMMQTSFWHPDGTPMSAQQFLETLFGRLPDFFQSEDQLRALWSVPDTRKKLLNGLADKGFGAPQLAEMQRLMDAENSDVFDVLAHVAYALPPRTRTERAEVAQQHIAAHFTAHFTARQRAFLDFVLSHYLAEGVRELDPDKLAPLLRLRYHNSMPDAVADLGEASDIRLLFTGFQKYLYQPQPFA